MDKVVELESRLEVLELVLKDLLSRMCALEVICEDLREKWLYWYAIEHGEAIFKTKKEGKYRF